jgi:hypothetical protein
LANDVGVLRLLAGEDVPADKEVRDDVRVFGARVFRLDVEDSSLVLDVVVETWNHAGGLDDKQTSTRQPKCCEVHR